MSTASYVELGSQRFETSYRALVMGILNRTPDSFYDAGSYWGFDSFLQKAEQLVNDGADFFDVGGVKAGPGDEVTIEEELERVVPAVEALHRRFDLPISVDTWQSEVLKASIEAGAVVANDISGFGDPDYLRVAKDGNATVVATHVRLAPRVPDPEPIYDNLVDDIVEFLRVRARWAADIGIPKERIILDAGLDLGKTRWMSFELLHASDRLASLGYPVLLSASNKRFLFEILDTDRYDIAAGTEAAHILGILRGCRIIRVHHARAARRVADLAAVLLETEATRNSP